MKSPEIGAQTELTQARLVIVQYLQQQYFFSLSLGMAKNAWDVSTAGGKPTKAIDTYIYLNLTKAAPEKLSSFYRQILHPRPFLRNTVHHVGSATRQINPGGFVFRVLSQNLVELDAGLSEFSVII